MRIVVLLFWLMLPFFSPPSLIQAQELKKTKVDDTTDARLQDKSSDPGNGDEYRIGVGDTLDIIVERRPELSWRGLVKSDGHINALPYLENPLRVLCLTERQVADAIKVGYAEIIREPTITVRVIERSTQPAFLLGAVRTPHRFQLQRDARLIELLFISGGVTDRASGDIQIFSPMPSTCKDSRSGDEPEKEVTKSPIRVIKILDLMAGADGANPIIGPADIVTVMVAEPVYVIGGVVSPQGINYRDQLTLSRAIATVGGLSSNAKGSDVHIYRRKQGGTEAGVINVDYNAIKDRKKPDIPLKAYDIIEVSESSGFFGRRTWQSAAQEIVIDQAKVGELPLRILN